MVNLDKRRVFSYNGELVVAVNINYDSMIAEIMDYHKYGIIAESVAFNTVIYDISDVKKVHMENLEELTPDQRATLKVLYDY